jgi:hypothetical protein
VLRERIGLGPPERLGQRSGTDRSLFAAQCSHMSQTQHIHNK